VETPGTTLPTGLRGFLVDNAQWLSAGAALCFLSSFGQTFFISVFAGEIRAEFGLSHGQWGAIYSLGTTVSAIAMVWAGMLTDVYRVRVLGPVVLVGLACACLAMALNSLVWLLPVVIFLLRFFGQGMSSHIAVVAMTRWFVATRGRALAFATLGFAVGEAFLPLIFVALLGVVDWRILWVVAAIIALTGLPVLARLLRHERTPQSVSHAQRAVGMASRQWTRAEALRHPLFWFMVPALLGPAAFNTAFFFQQVHYAQIKGWAHVDLVALFPLYTGLAIVWMMLSGWGLDKLGASRLMPGFQLPMVLAFLIFAQATGPAGAALGMFFMAMTSGAHMTLPNAFWAEMYGTAHIGSIKAMAAAVMVFGSAIGPGVTGVLIDAGIGLERQYILVAGYFVIASALMAVGIARARRSLPPRDAVT
jgi:MFS family permease